MCYPTLPGFSGVADLSPVVILAVTWEIWLLCLRTNNDQVLNSICSHKPSSLPLSILGNADNLGPLLQSAGKRQALYHWATPPAQGHRLLKKLLKAGVCQQTPGIPAPGRERVKVQEIKAALGCMMCLWPAQATWNSAWWNQINNKINVHSRVIVCCTWNYSYRDS